MTEWIEVNGFIFFRVDAGPFLQHGHGHHKDDQQHQYDVGQETRMPSKINTLESTPMPTVRVTRTMPGKVKTAPK
jgi:hypothetical protein